MDDAPPPPPPHGDNPRTKKSGGLPDGKYDIFVIPPSSAGSGFLYLPSLNTQRNSFLAGCACTATAFFFYSVAFPVVRDWFHNTIHGGGSGVLMLILGVGVVSWALGKTQGEGAGSTPSASSYFKGTTTPPGADTNAPPRPHAKQRATSGPDPEDDWGAPPPRPSRPSHTREHTPPPTPPPPPPPQEPTGPPPEPKKEPEPESRPDPKVGSPPPKPKTSWQRTSQNPDAKSAWEKAREETRRREEERKRAAEIQRRREELLKERERLREKETLERLEREWKEKKAKEEEAAKKAEEELKAKQTKEEAEKKLQREKERREREAREALLRAAKEARDAKEALEKARREEKEEKERKEKQEKEAMQAAAEDERLRHEAEIRAAQVRAAEMRAEDAERTRATAEARAAAASAQASNLSSNASKKPPMPSARTERDDDAYSFRPYDRPRTHKSSSGSVYSDDSYAQSASTARTTPPASTRGAYSTKDPDKVIIKGVYSFNNAFMRTPISQLISGQGNVTDGLILRITTEGLFIDDDVRGVPQREWDVKAWTLKLCESIELQGHLILRASVRDQEGKKYVFVLSQTEGWKVAVGLQRLRKGSQVRALGVAGMPTNEARVLLESLGWV